jgi:oligopeptidase B
VEAGDAEFFSVGAFDASPDATLLAWSSDTAGAEVLHDALPRPRTGEELPDVIEGTYYGTAWGADGRTLFYTRPDDAMRPHQVWRHALGTPVADDVLVHQEDDERFFVGIGTTKDERYLVLGIGSKVTSEQWVLEADDPTGRFRVVAPREQDVEYDIEHHGDRFLIVTNADGAENFKLVEAPDATPGREHWSDVVPHRPDVKLSGLDTFARHLVLFERADGLRRIRSRAGRRHDHVIEQPEEVSTAGAGANPSSTPRCSATATPRWSRRPRCSTTTWTPGSGACSSSSPCSGGYDPGAYVTERLWATAEDGTRVPMSVVRRADVEPTGDNPALLYGYGSYEASMDPGFSSLRLSLLDRGFVFAIAHVRGGGEMGRRWYTDGKYLKKRNTFTDFIACAEHLVAERWTSPRRLGIRGGSAGGLLVGRVANLRPDLFGAVVAQVPFVDALNTILDPSLPLTVLEWEEWGNPVESPEFYAYMKSYAPYENVEAKDYPAMFVTAGLNDPGCRTGSRPSGSHGCVRPRPTRTRCCSRPRWAQGTWAPPVATTPGRRRRGLRLPHRHAGRLTSRRPGALTDRAHRRRPRRRWRPGWSTARGGR